MAETPLTLVLELETLLRAAGYTSDRKAMCTLLSMRQALQLHEGVPASPQPVADYTAARAHALIDISLKLKKILLDSKKRNVSYSDRSRILSSVADNYLKLTHAFKVDNTVWSQAQTELVPMLIKVSNEKSIDAAILELDRHLDTYLTSLNSWLSR